MKHPIEWTEDERAGAQFPGLAQAIYDAETMLRMLGKGEGKPEWKPGLVMFHKWLVRKAHEARPLFDALVGLPERHTEPDTGDEPPGGSHQ